MHHSMSDDALTLLETERVEFAMNVALGVQDCLD